MSDLKIRGGIPLCGEVCLQGAKNSVLPILAATVLTQGVCKLRNCPQLSDVDAMSDILRHLGCSVQRDGEEMTVDATELSRSDVPQEQMRKLRCSVVLLGALTARLGQAQVAYPGGCDLGARPIDYHLSVLRQMGVSVTEQGGMIGCQTQGPPKAAVLSLAFPSVGATETAVLTAVLAQGVTTVVNAAREPEIADLCRFLQCCGAHISLRADGRLEIEGVRRLHGCTFHVMPDRIAAVTYLSAAAVTAGRVTVRGACAHHVEAVLPLFRQAGCTLRVYNDGIELSAPVRLHRFETVRTMPYPGFPTDAAPLLLSMACVAQGTSVFVENVFENRYRYVAELRRMGAKVQIQDRVAVVEGVDCLNGAETACTDLRGGAALLTAALGAQGTSLLTQTHHLVRGYQHIQQQLQQLGADIQTASA